MYQNKLFFKAYWYKCLHIGQVKIRASEKSSNCPTGQVYLYMRGMNEIFIFPVIQNMKIYSPYNVIR